MRFFFVVCFYFILQTVCVHIRYYLEFCVGRVLSQERNLALLLEYAKAHPKHTNILVTLPRGEFYAPFETAIPYDSFV